MIKSEKHELKNPYIHLKNFICFGCSPNNQFGLKMKFYEENDFIWTCWKTENHFSGYSNILHGGIQATLMDEIASLVIQIKLKVAGVTSRMNLKYKNLYLLQIIRFIYDQKLLIKTGI